MYPINIYSLYLVCFSLLITSLVFPTELFDHLMGSGERKKTGVAKLSDKEKSLLQKWIDTHYEKREAPVFQGDEEKHAILQENLLNGQFIRLSNQTLWEISPEDLSTAQGWITPVEIIVTLNEKGEHPHLLTNSLTGSMIRAKKTDKLPPKPTQKITSP